MRAEIIVILVVMVLALIVDWACLVMASDAEERAEIDRANLEKTRKSCEGCKNLFYYNDGSTGCKEERESVCISNNFVMWESKDEHND